MAHVLREVVAWAQFGPFVVSLVFLWLAHRRGSDVPVGERLWNVAGGLLYGTGFCLVLLSPGETAQRLGLLLVLASVAQSAHWSYRLRRRERAKRAV